MLKRVLFAVAFAAGALLVAVTPAQAAVPTIQPGDNLVVAYFSDSTKHTLVGQQWHRCNQPSGAGA